MHELDAALEQQKYAILEDAEFFLNHPELAGSEQMTSDYIVRTMIAHGLSPKHTVGTGIYADIGDGEAKIGLIADMDGIKVNGEVLHACGHHAQLTHLLGVMRVLKSIQYPIGHRCGVRLIAAPSEELARSEQRDILLVQKQITSRSGKMCMDLEGVFQQLQALVCCHLADDLPSRTLLTGYSTSGCMVLTLKLGNTGISRETQRLMQIFQEAIPVPGASVRFDLSGLVDGFMVVFLIGDDELLFQKLKATADEAVQKIHSLFSNQYVRVIDVCDAYAPLHQDALLSQSVVHAAKAVGFQTKDVNFRLEGFTDLGFLSRKIAVCHPLVGGTRGITHTSEFRVVDPYAAYILPVRMLLHMITKYLM